MFDLKALLDAHQGQELDLIGQHVNPQFAKVLRLIGFDVHYTRGQGQYLYDLKGDRYLDCLAGYGTFACGRNHPVIREALKQAMDMDLPNLPKMGPYRLSGLLARELIHIAPRAPEAPGDPSNLNTVFFTNCGAMGVETAIKYARAATGRPRIVHCKKSFHGLSLGALNVNGNDEFRDGFGPLDDTNFTAVPFNDLEALEAELARKDVAGFIVEPIQGKGVNVPGDQYLPGVAELCRKYGTVYIDDEVQTGFGRTGKMWGCQHWNVEPDIMITAKALSGGYVPVGAVLAKRWIYDKVFSTLDRCVVHSTTFGQNDLAMAAGLATLHVLREERIVENSATMGALLMQKLSGLMSKYELIREVRGKGLIIAIEFGPPKSMMLRAQWSLIHKIDPSLFPQAILMPLLSDHRILAQTAGHHLDVIKLLPTLVINAQDVDHIVNAFDQVIGSCSRVSGPMWEVGKRLGSQAIKRGLRPAGVR